MTITNNERKEKVDVLILMREYCEQNPREDGEQCSSCALIPDNTCTWWKDNHYPPKYFNYHCAGYEMDRKRITNILIRLEEFIDGFDLEKEIAKSLLNQAIKLSGEIK